MTLASQKQGNKVLTYDSFYHTYQPEVLRYCRAKCLNQADADDLCQEIFTYCWKHFYEYDPQKASYRTWLYVVVTSRYKNYCRAQKYVCDIEDFIDVLPDQKNSVEQAVFLEESRVQMAQALLKLSELEREIIVLHYFAHLSSAQIAKQLQMNDANVRQKQKRALKKLNQYME